MARHDVMTKQEGNQLKVMRRKCMHTVELRTFITSYWSSQNKNCKGWLSPGKERQAMKQCCVKDDTKLFCDRAINCNTMSCYFKEGWVRALPFICCIFSYYLLFQALGIALSLELIMCISSNKTKSLGRGVRPNPTFGLQKIRRLF